MENLYLKGSSESITHLHTCSHSQLNAWKWTKYFIKSFMNRAEYIIRLLTQSQKQDIDEVKLTEPATKR